MFIKKTTLALTVILVFSISGLIVHGTSLDSVPKEARREWNKTYGHISGVSILQVDSEDLVIAADAGTDWGYWAHGNYRYADRAGALFKIDPNGYVKWRKQLPVNPVALIKTRDGGFAIAGWTQRGIGVFDHLGLELQGYFISLVKTDSQGNVLWHQAYENQTELIHGKQDNRLWVKSALQTSDGGFILGGTKRRYESFDYYQEAWLMKTDSDGNRLWMNYYGKGEWDDPRNTVDEVVETAPDGFLFTGYVDEAIIVKTDSMGNIQWTKTYDNVRFHSMLKTRRGDFVFAGYQGDPEDYEKTAYVKKLDAAFNTVWNRKYENYSSFSIVESVDDGYLFTNSIYGGDSVIKTDFYGGDSLIKTDLEGNIEWTYKSNGRTISAIQSEDGKYALTGKIRHPETEWLSDSTDIMVEKIVLQPITTPTINISLLQNKTYITDSISLNFTVDEETSWICYSLDGQKNITVKGNTITLTGLSNGSHNLTVYANDTAGNTGVSETFTFNVAKEPDNPPAWTITVLAVAIVAVAVASILIYSNKTRKRKH